jgi:DNA mismatch endonuclease (patch repair protein)
MPEGGYPVALSADVSTRMRANCRRDTRPERRLRSALHARGMRFRVDHRIAAGSVSVRPDVVFTRARLAVFVDGCFWHACPEHGNEPQRNQSYWGPKLQRNVRRDRRVTAALEQDGWLVVRAWEHEEPAEVADRVQRALEPRREP